jgi:hypothetical protein
MGYAAQGAMEGGGLMRRRFLTVGGAAVSALVLAGCESAQPLPKFTYAERPCYRTLAEVDCHPRPLVGEESRRVGFYDEPVAVEQEEAWPRRLF